MAGALAALCANAESGNSPAPFIANTSTHTNVRASPSTAAKEVPYEIRMDSLIEPSSSAGHSQTLKPDTIVISNVNLSLGSGAARVHILKDINLRVARGEAVGLIGPSGSGKSTLLMVMAGLEQP